MSPSTDATPICITCSIFKRELCHLQEQGRLRLEVFALPSMLHMVPRRLEHTLVPAVAQNRRQGCPVVLAYGDCHARMVDMEQDPGVSRTRGANCCEILLGKAIYRTLIRDGVFFFMPEWALRWEEVFQQELGLRGETAREFMTDMHTRFVYLDTGILPVPEKELNAASAYAGLPWEILPVSLDNLVASVRAALLELGMNP